MSTHTSTPKAQTRPSKHGNRRPGTGKRVATGQEGIYRYVSARGPEHDTFTIKVGAAFAGTYHSLEDAMVARRRVKKAPLDMRQITCSVFATDFWEQLYSDHRANVTIRAYRWAIQPFLRTFGARRPADISRLEAKQWAKTVSVDCVRVARAMLNDAADAGLISRGENPLSNQRLPASHGRADQIPPGIATMVDMAATAESALHGFGPVLGAVIEFGFGSLMRPGELFHLQWNNIDPEGGYIEVLGNLRRDGSVGSRKMGESTVIALLPLARRALRRVPRRLDSPYVFTNETGGQLTASRLHDYWTQLRRYYAGKTGQQSILTLSFYLATRHAGATWLRNEVGVGAEDLRYQLGHRTLRTGDRRLDERLRLVNLYSHPDVVEALDRIRRAAEDHPLP